MGDHFASEQSQRRSFLIAPASCMAHHGARHRLQRNDDETMKPVRGNQRARMDGGIGP